LQCYALKTYIASLGHDVSVIDYRPKAITDGYKWLDIRRFWGRTPSRFIEKTRAELKVITSRRARYTRFAEFVSSHLNLSPRVFAADPSTLQDYDLIIVGSDQVWNTTITKGYDPLYWGEFTHSKGQLVSYAASMEDGAVDEKEVSARLKHFNKVSVRELSLAERLTPLVDSGEVTAVVDPTLLLGRDGWDRLQGREIEGDYLLFYQVRRSEKAYRAAQQLAKKKRLRFVCLSAKPELENSPELAAASVEDFVTAFRNASYIVTTSFHGTAFSLIYEKDFICYEVEDGKGSRQRGLLSALGLDARITSDPEGLRPISWEDIRERMSVLTSKSKLFINDCL
jgi:hypothetical protein